MKAPDEGSHIPPAMLAKLREIQARDRRVRGGTALLRGAAVLLTAMLAAMAVDWLVVLYDPHWRWALTLSALACAAGGVVWWALLPMARGRSMVSLASAVDQAHPALEERYSTLAEVDRSPDAPELRGSGPMIRKVAQQAAELSGRVVPEAVVQRAGLTRALQCFGVAAGVFLLLFAFDFSRAKILCERFWMPGGDFTFTRLHAKPGDLMIGKGESVTLEFAVEGKKTDAATLFLRPANGRDEIIPLRRTGTTNASFLFARSSVGESFDYRARAGDGQTPWHRITVAERPKLAQVRLRIIPPAYSQLPVREENALPHRVRALEGSRLEASFQADQTLARMELKFADGETLAVAESPDHSYHFDAVLTNTVSFTPVFINARNLDNQPKPSCEVVVYPDQPPTVKVLSPSDEVVTARPDDKVKIDFEARDDFGVASARLLVTQRTDTNTTTRVIPIPLKSDEVGARLVRKQVELDLAQFNLKQDQELSYVVQVTDTKENLGLGTPAGSQPNATQLAQSANAGKPADPSQPAQSRNDAKPSASDAKPAASDSKSASNNAKSPSNPREASQASPDQQNHLATRPPANSQPRPDAEGSQPPPNNMVKRVLDAGQCSSCQPMRILVDEWGRSFEGQQREKLEIAIDPVLRQLDELLGTAQELTDTTLAAGRSREGLTQKQEPDLDSSKDHLRQADGAVTELKSKTQGTPYAFIGLQLHDIRETHISPARQNLGAVALESAKARQDITNLQQASFEIKRAREKLAGLTQSYAAVKRDYKVADAMQRLKKMHQVFLEDTQAILGSKKPALNPQDRKVAEVDDAFVEKFQKLLEEKKKIMAELAKLLADDPRLLRRFLALEQLEGTTLRDQMTLLAQRQQSLTAEVAQWAGAGEKDRASLRQQFLAAHGAEQSDVAALAAQMHENMVTWLPLDVSPDSEPVAACRNLAAEAARLAADAARNTSPDTMTAGLDAAHKSLDQLRLLNARLPGLEFAEWSNPKLSTFSANRMNEVADLITRQSGWIKKVEAIRAGDYPQAAEVDQHRLSLDTTGLSEKLDAATAAFGSMSEEIKAKSDELTGTVHKQILPEQSDATDALSRKTVTEAARHQTGATAAFAAGEKQFDELLRLIIAKLDAAPPPTDVGQAKSLEEMLAMLQDEQKAAETLGIPCRPINVAVMKDWLKPGSNSGQMAAAQARAAQAQARQAAEKTDRVRDQAGKLAQQKAAELAETPDGLKSGPKRPSRSWNTLVSQLGDELRQGRDNVPPEQYRQAIEQYFNTISERMPATPASTNSLER